ncbi:MAG: hypothetical protein JO010_10480 [Alphaproteobacteria bacterium]|nr:hypothetical protein [Alphaproteobacteria bacterium]
MNEPWDKSVQSGALWQRWKMAGKDDAVLEAGDSGAPDALTLAAYAEDRLEGAARAAVEALLAGRPELAEDIAFARRMGGGDAPRDTGEAALAAIIGRASALVPGSGDRVIAFHRPAAAEPRWRTSARWSALAASFALIGYLGFALGTDASTNLASLAFGAAAGPADEMFDPPSGFLGGAAGETGST